MIFLSPASKTLILANIPEVLKLNCSSFSKNLSFSYTNDIFVPLSTLTTLATAPEDAPSICSPTTILLVKVV